VEGQNERHFCLITTMVAFQYVLTSTIAIASQMHNNTPLQDQKDYAFILLFLFVKNKVISYIADQDDLLENFTKSFQDQEQCLNIVFVGQVPNFQLLNLCST
jgi:hypothetical protein